MEEKKKKLLLLPNFDQLRPGRCTPPLRSRWIACAAGITRPFPRPFRYRFKSEPWVCSFEYMLAFWGEKKPADGASTCPPSCSNTRRSDFKTSTSAHAQLGPIQQRVAAHQVILNQMRLYAFFLFVCRAYSQQSAQM